MNPESRINLNQEQPPTAEQEAGLKLFERAKKMEAAAINLRETLAAMSEPYPADIMPEKRQKIDLFFEQIRNLIIDQSADSNRKLFLTESGQLDWVKYGQLLAVDAETLNQLFERTNAEIFLHIYLTEIDPGIFSHLTTDDMHQIWFYDQQGEKLSESETSFDSWMQTNGVPKIYSGNIVIAAQLWEKKIEKKGKKLKGSAPDTKGVAGLYFPPTDFNSDNPLCVLGLSSIKVQEADPKMTGLEKDMLTALHESTHQIDFYIKDRQGDDTLISEILAYRSRVYAASTDKHETFGFAELAQKLKDDYLNKVDTESSKKFGARKAHLQKAVEACAKLEKEYDKAIVQHILLNCLTLDDLIAWSFKLDDVGEIEKYLKWKKEKKGK